MSVQFNIKNVHESKKNIVLNVKMLQRVQIQRVKHPLFGIR